MKDPELRLLRYFVVVAQERHFGRAAERLHMAQPPLSQQIRKLEHAVDAELIDRSCRPIGLTPAGEALLAEARLCLEHGDRAFAAARRVAAGHAGHVRIGAMQAAVSGILSYAVREYRRSHPEVSMEVVDLGTVEQIDQLSDHRLDVGFLRGPVDNPALTVLPLLEDPLVVAVADDNPAADLREIAASALAHEPTLLWSRAAAPTVYADVVELFRSHRIDPPIVNESPRIESVLALVASGIGVAYLPTSFVNLRRAGVRFVPLIGPVPDRPLVLAWRTANSTAGLSSFVDAAKRALPVYLTELADRNEQTG